jgi:hypothetical protein
MPSPHHFRCARVAVAVLAVLGVRAAQAVESPSEARLREALRSAAAQVRALEDERAQWQLTQDQQKREIDSLKRQLQAGAMDAKTKKGSSQCDTRLTRCQAERFEQTAAAAKLEESLTHCEAAALDATIAVKAREEQADSRTKQKAALELTALAERAGVCEAKNAKLFEVAREILAQLSTSCPGEPVLGLKRVEIENFAQEAEDKLLEAKVKP